MNQEMAAQAHTNLQIRALQEDVAKLTAVVGLLIAWLPHELGEAAQTQLLDSLHGKGK